MLDERRELTPEQESRWKRCEDAFIRFMSGNSSRDFYCPVQRKRLKEVFVVSRDHLRRAKAWLLDDSKLDHVTAQPWDGRVDGGPTADEEHDEEVAASQPQQEAAPE